MVLSEQQIPPSEELTQKDLIGLQLRNEARKTNAQIVVGLVLLVGLYLTYRRITAIEKNVKVAQENVKVAQEGQITERFTRAIEQLGNQQLEIRLGGIYALERIAKDSAHDHWTIMEILTAYVREKAPWKEEGEQSFVPTERATDIQAILTVIGRRRWTDMEGKERINLSATNLSRADLAGANLGRINLVRANLTEARLLKADLRGGYLFRANFEGANLLSADLSWAYLDKANLSRAILTGTDLTGANLSRADLSGANLSEAKLTGADLSGAKLVRTHYNDLTDFPATLDQKEVDRRGMVRLKLNPKTLSK